MAEGKLFRLLLVAVALSATMFLDRAIPSSVEAYDGPSLTRWTAGASWRTMGTEIIRPVVTQCGQGGISIYEAKWQNDCNLVIYKDFEQKWSSNTRQWGYHVCYLSIQRDGNLVIFGERDDDRVPLWSSNSTRSYEDDFYVALTLYGGLAIFTSNNNAIWYSKDSNVPWP